MSNRFCFVAPMFNASKTLSRMMHSIAGQSYENWRIILIDDVSSDEEIVACRKIVDAFRALFTAQGFDDDRLHVTWNSEGRGKRWEVSNVLHGVLRCEDDDIVCRIDADDFLCDLDTLTLLNQVYGQSHCDALWTMHRWGFSDRNISASLPRTADPYTHPWVTSHFKTFRKRLLNGVPYENFTNMNGDLVRRCGDQAVYLPALKRATHRIFVPRVLYHYHIDEQGGAVYHTDDAKFQKAEADFIRARGYVDVGTPWEQVIT